MPERDIGKIKDNEESDTVALIHGLCVALDYGWHNFENVMGIVAADVGSLFLYRASRNHHEAKDLEREYWAYERDGLPINLYPNKETPEKKD